MEAGMVALLPADQGALALDSKSALPPSEIHLTLVYLGDDVSGWDSTRRQLLNQAARSAATAIGAPIEARVMGHATFNPDGGPDGDRDPCAVHLIGDTDRLAPARTMLATTMATLLGEDYPTQHEPFIPHTTAGEGLVAGDLTYCGQVVFDRLVLALAGDWQEYPLAADPVAEAIRPYARTAYAQGFARSGGPLTDAVKAGCVAAVALAVANAHHPGVLEATLTLGALEGMWAAVYDRREKLVAKHLTTVAAAWRRAAHRLDVGAAVDRYRASLGFTREAFDTTDTTHRRLVANAIATAVAQAIAGEDATPADKEAIINAISNALVDAEAEGYAAAVVVGAEQLGVAVPGFDLVFTDAHDALADLGSHWADANGWLGRMVSGNATDLGARLSALAADGASYEEMVRDAADIVGGDDIRAVSTMLDLAMGQSFSRGALSLYAREGVTQVDFVTAGGARVCPACLAAEDKNPWDRNSVPTPPLHPYCRCALQPSDPMQGLANLLTRYAVAS
ncbi:MAG: hypothetical protein ACREQ5_00135 [Candidatus Dormibacteria bacterium]